VHVVLTDVNDEQLDCTFGIVLSIDCKLDAAPVPFGNRLPVVTSSACAAVNKSKNAISHFIFFSYNVLKAHSPIVYHDDLLYQPTTFLILQSIFLLA
jgi:hypothetical protein